MQAMPEAFAPLATVNQWVLYRVVPSTKRPGKTDKFPVDHRTGEVGNAQDPAIWTDAATAMAAAERLGLGVGFVFTEAAGFWCLDVDGCLLPNGMEWSPIVHEISAQLPGVAIEVSASGKGLHYIGYGKVPPHRSKPPAEIAAAIAAQYPGVSIEFYHDLRFIALTGTRAMGNAGVTPPLLDSFLARYFPPGAGTSSSDDLIDEARADWQGHTDDDQLIEAALNAPLTPAAVLGGDVTFRQLWECDSAALAVKWPDGNREYDASSADMSLAQRLCFWTGCNGARIERLMRRSALVRDKWDSHPTYLARTINLACSRQDRVHSPAQPTVPVQPMQPLASLVTGSQFLFPAEQMDYFKGCVYIRGLHRVYVPDGSFLKPEQFAATYGGYIFSMDPAGDKTTKNAFEVFTGSQAVRFPKVANCVFRPETEPGAIIEEEGIQLVNTYVPIETLAIDGNPAPFLEFIGKLLPDLRDQQILLSYLAACVQYPGVKFQWWPVLQGVEGNGKTLIISAMAHAIGNRYTFAPNVDEIAKSGNKFNGWIQNRLFVAMEEIYVENRRDFLNAFKTTVTNERLPVESKGVDQIMTDNRANGIMATNFKAGVPVSTDQRRYCIFFTAQQSKADLLRDGMAGDYFPNLYDWCKGRGAFEQYGRNYGFAVINNFLRSYQIVAEFNPARACQTAPKTSTTDEAIEESRGSVEQEILEAVDEGRVGFCGGWISSMFLEKLLKNLGASKQIPPKKRRDLLRAIGYDWHPALPEGRVNNAINPDSGKPRLYIKNGHIHANLRQPSEVVRHYTEAQSGGMQPPGSAAQVFQQK